MSTRPFARRWLADQPESARRSAGNMAVIVPCQLLLIIVATALTSPGRASYNRAHGGLFIVSILVVAMFLAVKGKLTTMLGHTWRTALRPGQATLPQIVDALTVLSLLIALATLAFIVDLSFFTHGFRIGGGIAVSLLLVVKAFVQRWTAT